MACVRRTLPTRSGHVPSAPVARDQLGSGDGRNTRQRPTTASRSPRRARCPVALSWRAGDPPPPGVSASTSITGVVAGRNAATPTRALLAAGRATRATRCVLRSPARGGAGLPSPVHAHRLSHFSHRIQLYSDASSLGFAAATTCATT